MLTNRYFILPQLLFIVLTVGSVYIGTAFANDSFSQKIGIFREELGGYHSSLRPNERYDVGVRINNALIEVLREEKSLESNPSDIIGDDGGFNLKFGEWVSVGEKRYRLVILDPKEINMGAMTTVYSQTWAGGTVSMTEKVHLLTQGTSIGRLVYSEIINYGNEGFLLFAEKNYGPEHKYVSFYTQRLENDKWQEYMRPPGVTARGQWTIRTSSRSFSLKHAAMGWDSENDYEVKADNGDFEIGIVDKANRPLDSIRVCLVEGTWVIR